MAIAGIILGLLAGLIFLVTGAGVSSPTHAMVPALAASFGSLAGSPILLVLSFGSTMSGLHFYGESREIYPSLEFFMALAAGLSALFFTFVPIGALANYSPQTITILYVSAVVNDCIAIYFGINLARQSERVNWLYISACIVTVANLLGIISVLIFMGGA